MNGCAAENDSHTRGAGINLRYHFGLLICGATNHKDDDILRLVPRVSTTLEEGVLQFLQAAFDEILKSHFQSRGVLRVNVLDTFKALKAAACAGKEGG